MAENQSIETGLAALLFYQWIQNPCLGMEREAQEYFGPDRLRELSLLFVSVVDFISFLKMEDQPEAQEHMVRTLHGLLQSHDETAVLADASVDFLNSRITAYDEAYQGTEVRSIAEDLAKKYCALIDHEWNSELVLAVAAAILRFMGRVADALTDKTFVVGTERLEELLTLGGPGVPEWPGPTDDDSDVLSSDSEHDMHAQPSPRPMESLNAPVQKSSGCVVAFAAILAPIVVWMALA